MKEKQKTYDITLLVTIVILFAFLAFSIIYSTINFSYDDGSNNLLPIIYMFLHMIILGFLFYQTFSGMVKGGKFIKVVMLDENGRFVKNAFIKALIASGLGLIVGIYFTLTACKLPIPLSNFTVGLSLALMNVGYGIFIGGLFFAIYPFLFGNKEISQ